MSAERFIDTNIFVCHLDGTDTRKQGIAEQLVRCGLVQGDACIGPQVVQECLNVALREARVPLRVDAARACLDHVLSPMLQINPAQALQHRALHVQSRWRCTFHDLPIVSAALLNGCRRLLTEDLQHGQSIDASTIENILLA